MSFGFVEEAAAVGLAPDFGRTEADAAVTLGRGIMGIESSGDVSEALIISARIVSSTAR